MKAFAKSFLVTVAAALLGLAVLFGGLGILAACSGTTYTVTFDANGGSGAPEAYTGVEEGSKIQKPVVAGDDGVLTLTRDGYVFDGEWYTDAAQTDRWLFGVDTVSGDMTLYAGWEEIKVSDLDPDALSEGYFAGGTNVGVMKYVVLQLYPSGMCNIAGASNLPDGFKRYEVVEGPVTVQISDGNSEDGTPLFKEATYSRGIRFFSLDGEELFTAGYDEEADCIRGIMLFTWEQSLAWAANTVDPDWPELKSEAMYSFKVKDSDNEFLSFDINYDGTFSDITGSPTYSGTWEAADPAADGTVTYTLTDPDQDVTYTLILSADGYEAAVVYPDGTEKELYIPRPAEELATLSGSVSSEATYFQEVSVTIVLLSDGTGSVTTNAFGSASETEAAWTDNGDGTLTLSAGGAETEISVSDGIYTATFSAQLGALGVVEVPLTSAAKELATLYGEAYGGAIGATLVLYENGTGTMAIVAPGQSSEGEVTWTEQDGNILVTFGEETITVTGADGVYSADYNLGGQVPLTLTSQTGDAQ